MKPEILLCLCSVPGTLGLLSSQCLLPSSSTLCSSIYRDALRVHPAGDSSPEALLFWPNTLLKCACHFPNDLLFGAGDIHRFLYVRELKSCFSKYSIFEEHWPIKMLQISLQLKCS